MHISKKARLCLPIVLGLFLFFINPIILFSLPGADPVRAAPAGVALQYV